MTGIVAFSDKHTMIQSCLSNNRTKIFLRVERSSVRSMSATVDDNMRQNPGKCSSDRLDTNECRFSFE